jgi:hypothetical protein
MPYLMISWSIEPRYIYNELVEVSDLLPTTAEIWRITFCLWCNHARINGEWDNGRVHVACVFCHYSAFAFVSDFGTEYYITFVSDFGTEYYITFVSDFGIKYYITFGAEHHITFGAEYHITFGDPASNSEDSPMECDAYVSSHD